jgi:N-acetylglutamate synthase-like GNAT family acetyltransferase
MQNIILRSPKPTEYLVIRSLIAKNNLNPFGLDWDSFIVAADEDNKLVGCGQIKCHDNLKELASLVVSDDWQGRGVSTLLMEGLLARADRPLWLMCESSLTEFYERYGFRELLNPNDLPDYFKRVHWGSRIAFGLVFFLRGTHLAVMRLDS